MKLGSNSAPVTLLLVFPVVMMLLLTGCNGGGKSEGEGGAADSVSGAVTTTVTGVADTAGSLMVPAGPVPTQGLRIAWVSMDTILQGYDYYFAMEREMAELTASAERELMKKGEALQNKVLTFQDNVQKGLLTRSQAQSQQEQLAQEQTLFLQMQEQKRIQLQEEEQVRLRRVQVAISEFLNRYNKDHGYHYILSMGVLFGDPRLSITQEVLQGLNEEYAARHAAKREAQAGK